MQTVQAIRFSEDLVSLGRAGKALATAPQQLLPRVQRPDPQGLVDWAVVMS